MTASNAAFTTKYQYLPFEGEKEYEDEEEEDVIFAEDEGNDILLWSTAKTTVTAPSAIQADERLSSSETGLDKLDSKARSKPQNHVAFQNGPTAPSWPPRKRRRFRSVDNTNSSGLDLLFGHPDRADVAKRGGGADASVRTVESPLPDKADFWGQGRDYDRESNGRDYYEKDDDLFASVLATPTAGNVSSIRMQRTTGCGYDEQHRHGPSIQLESVPLNRDGIEKDQDEVGYGHGEKKTSKSLDVVDARVDVIPGCHNIQTTLLDSGNDNTAGCDRHLQQGVVKDEEGKDTIGNEESPTRGKKSKNSETHLGPEDSNDERILGKARLAAASSSRRGRRTHEKSKSEQLERKGFLLEYHPQLARQRKLTTARGNNVQASSSSSPARDDPFLQMGSRSGSGCDSVKSKKSVLKTKSIVGSRPCHWASSDTVLRNRSLKPTTISMKPRGRRAGAGALAEATKTTTHLCRKGVEAAAKAKRRRALSAACDASFIPFTTSTSQGLLGSGSKFVYQKKKEHTSDEAGHRCRRRKDSGRWQLDIDTRGLSFTPSFSARSSCSGDEQRSKDDDEIVNDELGDRAERPQSHASTPLKAATPGKDAVKIDEHDNPHTLAPSGADLLFATVGQSSSQKRRTLSSSSGVLSRRLFRLRARENGAQALLNSGSNPFRKRQSDKQNRAELSVDVTIICDPATLVPSDQLPTGSPLIFVCYIHCVNFTGKRKLQKGSEKHMGCNTQYGDIHDSVSGGHGILKSMGWEVIFDEKDEATSNISKASSVVDILLSLSRLTLVYFTPETVRELRLTEGSHVRIYDCVRVAPREEKKGTTGHPRMCLSKVLCTELCEPYASSLPFRLDFSVVKRNLGHLHRLNGYAAA